MNLPAISFPNRRRGVSAVLALFVAAGFGEVAVYPAWDGLPVYDAKEWVAYVALTSLFATDLL